MGIYSAINCVNWWQIPRRRSGNWFPTANKHSVHVKRAALVLVTPSRASGARLGCALCPALPLPAGTCPCPACPCCQTCCLLSSFPHVPVLLKVLLSPSMAAGIAEICAPSAACLCPAQTPSERLQADPRAQEPATELLMSSSLTIIHELCQRLSAFWVVDMSSHQYPS